VTPDHYGINVHGFDAAGIPVRATPGSTME